ncbi:hypothetical protein LCGC14_0174780 [marine sediment metagenome]|uniref:Uncharacterized protein n=1 Tax=marine sediment metagenome TaxID=412755 RepID=A0A0F9UV39_9ZZZZ
MRFNRTSSSQIQTIEKGKHGNTQHHLIRFTDTYEGDAAFVLAPFLRLYGVEAPISTHKTKSPYITESIIHIHRNCGISPKVECTIYAHSQAYYAVTEAQWDFAKRKEAQIRRKVERLDASRMKRLRRGRQLENYTLEEDAPELFFELPKA